MDIAEQLFLTMKQKKITQNQLAEALGTNQPTIAHWKTGTKIPIEYVDKICKLLDVSADYLIRGVESKDYYTSEERNLVEQFRKVPEEAQSEIEKFIEFQIYKSKGE